MAADVLLFSNSRPPGAEVPFAHAATPLREHLGDRTVWFAGWAGQTSTPTPASSPPR